MEKPFEGNDGLRVKHAQPRPLEMWWKPGRLPGETEWLRKFEQLPEAVRERLIAEASDGVIPGTKITEALSAL